MRRRFPLRPAALPRTGLVLAVLVSGTALAGAASAETSASAASQQNSIRATIQHRRLAYGQKLIITGQAPAGAQDRRVVLQFARTGSHRWQRLTSAGLGAGNRFHFHVILRWSGRVKVTASAPAPTPAAGDPTGTPPAPSRGTSPGQPSSQPQHVAVMAGLYVRRHTVRDLGHHSVAVRGTLMPRTGGRQVRLQTLERGGWQTVASARTSRKGRFQLQFVPRSSEQMRVRFAGSPSNGPVAERAGSVTVFHQGVASWYQDGGNTGCGFHAHYGVANVSLPCGTKVTFVYNGRSVTATVDDRGPYVGGREWDLNQNTAGALGFSGVASVWASR